MESNTILSIMRKEIFSIRSEFIANASMRNRAQADYKDNPGLLETDLAYLVVSVLCAGRALGMEPDIDAAVRAGRSMFEAEHGDRPVP